MSYREPLPADKPGYQADEPCCDYRDHSGRGAYGFCPCPDHPRSTLHPYGDPGSP